MKKIHPNWSTKQVMKHLSKLWNRMTEDEKERYRHLSTQDRTRFEVQRRKHKLCQKSGKDCTCK